MENNRLVMGLVACIGVLGALLWTEKKKSQNAVKEEVLPEPKKIVGKGKAIAGFVLSIIAFLQVVDTNVRATIDDLPLLIGGFIFSVLGLVFSAVGKSQLKASKGSTGLATAGFVLSVISLAMVSISITNMASSL